jgi:hypothetical protein
MLHKLLNVRIPKNTLYTLTSKITQLQLILSLYDATVALNARLHCSCPGYQKINYNHVWGDFELNKYQAFENQHSTQKESHICQFKFIYIIVCFKIDNVRFEVPQ